MNKPTTIIYLAGPLFTKAEQEFNLTVYRFLTKEGFTVFLPQMECDGKALDDIFATCKRGIDDADIILAVLDGADADSGTCWECGYAYANGKKIIGIRTDFRQSGDTKGYNAMLYFSASKLIEPGQNYLEEIARALKD